MEYAMKRLKKKEEIKRRGERDADAVLFRSIDRYHKKLRKIPRHGMGVD